MIAPDDFLFRLRTEPPPVRIGGIEAQDGSPGDMGGPAQMRHQLTSCGLQSPGEQASRDALLTILLPDFEQALRVEKAQLGRGPGAARRAVVCPTRTKDEVLRMGVGTRRGAGELDVVDRRSVLAGQTLVDQLGSNAPCGFQQAIPILELQSLAGQRG